MILRGTYRKAGEHMKYISAVIMGGAIALSGLALSGANATTIFDGGATDEVIFGSGNANGGFTLNRRDGVELGLRGKLRFNASNNPENTFNSNGDGTYSFDAGAAPGGFSFAPNSPTTPVWNFEWSVNSNYDGTGGNLGDYQFILGIDFDAGSGTSFLIIDLFNLPCADHAIGTNATANGAGISADCSAPSGASDFATLVSQNNLGQNSWNMEFFNNVPFDGFDPNVDGTYRFFLSALDEQGTELNRTDIDIIVGAGATDIPAPASLALLGMGLVGFGIMRRRRS